MIQPIGNLAQYAIAADMAVCVVDNFEMVEVDEQHSQLTIVAFGMLDGMLQAGVEQQPVGQRGERIVVRQKGELFFRFLDSTDVGEYNNVTRWVALFIAHRCDCG